MRINFITFALFSVAILSNGCMSLMSIYRTLKQRGVDPVATTATALRTYAQTSTLPPLPAAASSKG